MIYAITEQKIDGTAEDNRLIGYFNRFSDAKNFVKNKSNKDYIYCISKLRLLK